MTPQPLPTSFIVDHTSLSWREALWGYEHQWADWSCLVELATRRVSSGTETKSAEVELAGMLAVDSFGAGDLARKLANEEPVVPEEELKRKWLFLILQWLFDKRERFSDPLAVVEDVFCDFGHPLEIRRLIRYMPPSDDYDPRQHSKAENEKRLLDHWREYLATAQGQFGK